MSYKGWDARAPRRNEWYWAPLVKSQRLSGLSQKKFCDQEGISYASFKNWSSRLKEGSAELQELDEEIGSFVPAVLTAGMPARDLPEAIHEAGNLAGSKDWNFTPSTNGREEKSDSATELSSSSFPTSALQCLTNLEIRFDPGAKGKGFGIAIPQGFDELTLRRLLKVVGAHDV